MQSIGGRIAYLRTKAKLSQEELARQLKVSRSALAMWERDEREPNVETIKRMADVFDVPVSFLLGADGYSESVDPEWAELFEKVKAKGSEMEATALLRSAAKLSKGQLRDILKILEHIEASESDDKD